MDTYDWKSKTDYQVSSWFNRNGVFDFCKYNGDVQKYLKANIEKFEVKKDVKSFENLNDCAGSNPYFLSSALGFVPVPMHNDNKQPVVKNYYDLSLDNNDYDAFNKTNNASILTGRKSMVFVIDIDKPKNDEIDGMVFLNHFNKEYNKSSYGCGPGSNQINGHYANTMVQRSGGGGLHFIYQYEPAFDLIKTHTRFTMDDVVYSIDIKSNKGTITFTPSKYGEGNKYQLLDEYDGVKTTRFPNQMPRWLLAILMNCLQKKDKFDTGKGCAIKPYMIASFDYNNKTWITPEMKIKDNPIVIQNAKVLDDNVEKIVRLLKPERWDNRDDWLKLIFGLKNVSKTSGDPKRYLRLCHEISKLSDKYDDDAKDQINDIWNNSDENKINVGTFIYWLKQDVAKEVYRDVLGKIGVFKSRNNYYFTDYVKLKNKNFQDKNDRNDIYEFIRTTIFPIRSSTDALYFIVKGCRYDSDYDKEYAFYSNMIDKNIRTHLSDILIKDFHRKEVVVKKRGRKNKDEDDDDDYEMKIVYENENLYNVLKFMSLEHFYSSVSFMPYSPLSNPSNIELAKTKYNAFNYFSGFCNTYDSNFKIDMESVKPALQQLREFCPGGDIEYNFLLSWLAHLIQHPERKTGKIVILKSFETGVGKSTFFSWFGNTVIGRQYYLCTDDIDKVTNKFNSAISGKIFTVMEEVDVFEGDRNVNAKIKNLITNTHQLIEFKGRDPIQIEDHNNYIILTNKDNSLKVDYTDRRICQLSCERVRGVNDPHWKFMNDVYYKDPNTSLHFYHYLMRVKDVIANIAEIPDTEARKASIQRSAPPLIEFLYRKYTESWIDLKSEDTELLYRSRDIVEQVNEIGKETNQKTNEKNLKQDMINHFKIEPVRHRYPDGSRANGYKIPKQAIEIVLNKFNYDLTDEDDINDLS